MSWKAAYANAFSPYETWTARLSPLMSFIRSIHPGILNLYFPIVIEAVSILPVLIWMEVNVKSIPVNVDPTTSKWLPVDIFDMSHEIIKAPSNQEQCNLYSNRLQSRNVFGQWPWYHLIFLRSFVLEIRKGFRIRSWALEHEPGNSEVIHGFIVKVQFFQTLFSNVFFSATTGFILISKFDIYVDKVLIMSSRHISQSLYHRTKGRKAFITILSIAHVWH